MKVIIALLLFTCTSCLHRGDRIKYEQGIVINKHMTNGRYQTHVIYHRRYYGRPYRGYRQYTNVPSVYTEYIPPYYTVTFKCEHQKIFDIHREDVFNNLNDFDTVTIEFYDMLNGDGITKDYDFITAYKQKNNATIHSNK